MRLIIDDPNLIILPGMRLKSSRPLQQCVAWSETDSVVGLLGHMGCVLADTLILKSVGELRENLRDL